MGSTIHTTLIFRLSSIGDIVLATPFIRILRRTFPESRIDFAVRREFSEILRYNPYLSNLYEIDASAGRNELQRWRDFFLTQQYDQVFDLHNNFRTKFMRAGLPAPVVTVNKRSARRWLLTRFKWNLLRGEIPVAERYIETASAFGLVPDGAGAELHVPREIESRVKAAVRKENDRQSILALCPGAKHWTKRWPVESFTLLAREWTASPGRAVFVLGGPEDQPLGNAIRQGAGEKVRNFCGHFTILETAALLDLCDAVVSNDTGLMHIAAARRRPLVAIFGSTVQEFGFFPYLCSARILERTDLSCRPCSHIGLDACPRTHFRCMREIDPERVSAALHDLLATS